MSQCSLKTIKNYKLLLRLFCLNENLANYNEVYINLHYKISEKNQTFISKETIRACLSAILWYLRTYYSLNTKLINEYSLLLTHIRKSCAFDTKNHLNIKVNIPVWSYFENKRKEWLSQQNYKKYLVASVYTLTPPRRLLDYANMIVIKSKSLIEEYNRNNNEQNYYCYDDKIFGFCYYKTCKTHKMQIIQIPDKLDKIIKKYIEIKNIKFNDSLFGISDFEKLIQKTFNCGVNAIRHSYISNFYNTQPINYNSLKTLSEQMAHTIDTNIGYYKKNVNKSKKINVKDKYENPESLRKKSKINIILDNDSPNVTLIIFVIMELLHKFNI